MILVKKRQGVKITIHGSDAEGKNTTRSLLVADAEIDDVVRVVEAAIREEGRRQLLEADHA